MGVAGRVRKSKSVDEVWVLSSFTGIFLVLSFVCSTDEII